MSDYFTNPPGVEPMPVIPPVSVAAVQAPPVTLPGAASMTYASPNYVFAFEPKGDMTPVEAAQCAFLFATMVAAKGMMDSRSFIEEHNLQRHFKQ